MSQKASKAFCELLRPGKPASVSGIRYRRGPPMVRNMRAVLKKASWGTRRIFRGIRCKKQAFPVRKRYSVPKTAFSGTRRIFKGPQNSRLHRLWTVSCRTGRIFSARNGPRSEVIRLKRGCIPWKCLKILLRNLTGFSKNYFPAASRHNAGMTFSI